jgi:hypothetical protein
MIRNKVGLGEILRVRWLLQDSGVGLTGKSANTALIIRRDVDHKCYDFDDDTWQTTPTTPFTTLLEDDTMGGSYYYDLDTSTMLLESVITCHMTCDDPVQVEEIQFDIHLPELYQAHAVISHDYVSGQTLMGAMLLNKAGVVITADRAWFTVYKVSDGSKLLNAKEITAQVAGIFTHTATSLGLAAHTAYFLEISVEANNQSYRDIQVFTTL